MSNYHQIYSKHRLSFTEVNYSPNEEQMDSVRKHASELGSPVEFFTVGEEAAYDMFSNSGVKKSNIVRYVVHPSGKIERFFAKEIKIEWEIA